MVYGQKMKERVARAVGAKRGRPTAVPGPAKKKAWKSLRDSWAGRARIVGDIVNVDASGLWEVLRRE
jgi:hypothetical protein